MQQTFDRAAEDLGNIIHLEHVNVQIPDQRLATLFYCAGLGLTRDPYLMTSDDNMWVNVGRSQFHLPTGKAQVLRGHTGIVIAGREALLARLASVRRKLGETRFGRITLGIPYVELDVPAGTAAGIARFYRDVMEAPAQAANGDATVARVKVGKDQYLVFRETDREPPPFDEHHVQIYIANFSRPHRRLVERGLITAEDNQYQYRFRDIVDLDSGRPLFTVEHEVRCVTHPMFLRPLVNRNPAQTNRAYAPGHDQAQWAMGPEHFDDQP